MIKKNKLWQIIWIIGIYLILVIVLYLIVQYKIKFEDIDYSKYLYFYNCSSEICTTDIKQEEYINKIICEEEKCPYIKEKTGNNALLVYPKKELIYDYKNDKIINEDYQEYHFLDDEIIQYKDNNKYGIINTNNEIINEAEYDEIITYKNDILIYKNNEKYGIKTISNDELNISPKYDDLKYIDKKMFIAKLNDKYQIYNFAETPISSEYNYIFAENEYIFAFENNKLDILNNKLSSILVIKIKTYLNYTSPKEIKTLNIRVEEGIVSFNIYVSDNNIVKYQFDTNKGTLIN